MKRVFFILLSLSYAVMANAQVINGEVDGIVIDSVNNTPLDLATVSVFGSDSTLVSYQLSDRQGKFHFKKLPLNQEMFLLVSYVGYDSKQQTFRLDTSTATKNFKLLLPLNLYDSNAVILKSIVPIRMNGDTLEINPAAFKMDKTSVVEELLNQVPGITIWADGTITVNGRKVPRILVDGKPFFNQSNHAVATQNLPKDAIEKIQLYQEIDGTKDRRDNSELDSIYTMNIKLKENKKSGHFGKAGAGLGTDKRYEADASMQVYSKRNSLAIGGGLNNTNKNIGGLQEMLSNNTFRQSNPNIFNVGNFEQPGVNKSFSIGGMYTHHFDYTENGSSANNIAADYNKSGNTNKTASKILQERTTKDFTQFIESSMASNAISRMQNAGVNYQKSISGSGSSALSINGNTNTSISSDNNTTFVRDSSKMLQSTNAVIGNTASRSRSGNINLNTNNYGNVNELKRFSFNGIVSYNNYNINRDAVSRFGSYTDPASDTSINRSYLSSYEHVNANVHVSYNGLRRLLFRRFALFGVDLFLQQYLNYYQHKNTAAVSDFDSVTQSFKINAQLTSNDKMQTLQYRPTLALHKSFSKWNTRYNRNISLFVNLSKMIAEEKNRSSFSPRNVDRSFSFFTPSVGVGYNYGKMEKFGYNLNIQYSRSYSYPTVDQLYALTDSINLYELRFGNKHLKNTKNDFLSFNFSINKRKPGSKYDIGGALNGSINQKTDPITDSVINSVSGKRLLYYINAGNGRDNNFHYSLNVSRKIRKNSIQLQYIGSTENSTTYHFIDQIRSKNTTMNFSHQIDLQYSLKTLLILKLSEGIRTNSSSQSAYGLTSSRITTTSTQLGVTYNHSKNVSFNTTLSTIKNSNLADNIILWHAFSIWRFLKTKQAEVKFSAFDLLKKFQNIYVYSANDGTSTYLSNGLQQYFLITFSYYPRKFGKQQEEEYITTY